MDRISVHVWLPGQAEPTLAGEFWHDDQVGRFLYASDYLAAQLPALAPDLPLRPKPQAITGGHAIFPLFLDAGHSWGRHVLERKLERSVTELEALSLCPTDGVGNIALGALTDDRLRVLKLEEFLDILHELEAGGHARDTIEEQVLDAHGNGTSMGGTKPKLTIERNGALLSHTMESWPRKGLGSMQAPPRKVHLLSSVPLCLNKYLYERDTRRKVRL